MSAYRSTFLATLADRGFIQQVSEPANALDELAASGPITAYIGFDCTAPSLHVGSLLPIMMLYWLQQTGHRPIALMGGGTTRVGDPSGKDESRRILTDEMIEQNLRGIRRIFSNFLIFEDSSFNAYGTSDFPQFGMHKPVAREAIMANNADWLSDLNYIEFLRIVGKHFSVNRMLSFDSVSKRLDREQELSFLEFNYMVLQAYDFVALHKRYDCVLQMGGSDQWGNIVNGIDLGRRMFGTQLFALTSPLITTSSGAKMGKTAAGAVWLDADLVTPTDYWQFWRNTDDRDVVRFLKLFTTLPLHEIEHLASLRGEEINEAKKILATEATAMIHGRISAESALRNAQQTYESRNFNFDTKIARIPFALLNGNADSPFFLANACVLAEFARTTSEARKRIKEGVIRINDKVVIEERYILTPRDLADDGTIKLSLGKKQHIRMRPI